MDRIIKLLPKNIAEQVINSSNKNFIEEIRLSIGKPVIVIARGCEEIKTYKVTSDDIKVIVQKISNYSLYAFEDEIRQGYITIDGGHRVGISGQCVIDKNSVKTIKYISSLNIRVAREIVGCSDKIMKYIVSEQNVKNILIVSPPKCGKTTLIRDISRNISNGYKNLKFKGKRVAIIDERSEIASCHRGIPQMNVGMRTDVYDNCIKSEGMIMAIRTMAPDVIVCDEIGTKKDVEGLVMAFNSGVSIICSIHGNSVEEVYKRQIFREILEDKLINKIIVLSNRNGVGSIETIYDV